MDGILGEIFKHFIALEVEKVVKSREIFEIIWDSNYVTES